MFLLTGRITFTDVEKNRTWKTVGHSFTWRHSVNDISSTAEIVLPGLCSTEYDPGKNVPTGLIIKPGFTVIIEAGYNGVYRKKFVGFVGLASVSKNRLHVKCEGYSYQLRQVKDYSFSAVRVKLSDLLSDLIRGTNIKISPKAENVELYNIYFKNVSKLDVLTYLKEQCRLTVYIFFDELYAGLKETDNLEKVRYRLGWNSTSDNLEFVEGKERTKVNIVIEKRRNNGTKIRASSGSQYSATKTIKVRHIDDEKFLEQMALDQQQKSYWSGYEGSLTAFLEPHVLPGMSAKIEDMRFPDRNGVYFIESVEGSFGPSGGRQQIAISNKLSK